MAFISGNGFLMALMTPTDGFWETEGFLISHNILQSAYAFFES